MITFWQKRTTEFPDGVVALSDTWNAEVNSLFLPCDSTLNIAGKTKTTTDKAIIYLLYRISLYV
jgi:hypothetical protein